MLWLLIVEPEITSSTYLNIAKTRVCLRLCNISYKLASKYKYVFAEDNMVTFFDMVTMACGQSDLFSPNQYHFSISLEVFKFTCFGFFVHKFYCTQKWTVIYVICLKILWLRTCTIYFLEWQRMHTYRNSNGLFLQPQDKQRKNRWFDDPGC